MGYGANLKQYLDDEGRNDVLKYVGYASQEHLDHFRKHCLLQVIEDNKAWETEEK